MLTGATMACLIAYAVLLCDSVISGLMIGEIAVNAVNLVSPIFSAASFFAMIVSLGVPILYTNALGRFRKEEAERISGAGAASSVLCGILLFLFFSLWGNDFLGIYDVDPQTMTYAISYLKWLKFAVLLIPIDELLFALVFADGDETVSTLSSAVEIISNIILSVILCQVIGIAGIGLGSFIGRILSITVNLSHFIRKDNTLHFVPNMDHTIILSIIRYSVIDAGAYLFIAIFNWILNEYIIKTYGSSLLIIVSIVIVVKEFQVVFDGITEAMTPIISVYNAENCALGIRRTLIMACKTAVTEGIIVSVLLFALSGMIPKIMGIADPETVMTARTGIRIMCFAMPFHSVLYVMIAYFLVIGRIRLGFVTKAMSEVVLSIPIAVILSSVFGIYGLFAGIALSPLVVILLLLAYLMIKYRSDISLGTNRAKEERRSLLYDFEAKPDDIVDIRNRIEEEFIKLGYKLHDIMKPLLMFEEMFMMIHDANEPEIIDCECSVNIGTDRVRITGWDNGKKTDISDEDMSIRSLREYAMSILIQNGDYSGRYLLTMSFNRNMIEIPLGGSKNDTIQIRREESL